MAACERDFIINLPFQDTQDFPPVNMSGQLTLKIHVYMSDLNYNVFVDASAESVFTDRANDTQHKMITKTPISATIIMKEGE